MPLIDKTDMTTKEMTTESGLKIGDVLGLRPGLAVVSRTSDIGRFKADKTAAYEGRKRLRASGAPGAERVRIRTSSKTRPMETIVEWLEEGAKV